MTCNRVYLQILLKEIGEAFAALIILGIPIANKYDNPQSLPSVLFLLIEYFFIANKLRNNATNLQIFCEIGNYRCKIEMLRRSFADHIYSYGFSKSSSSVTFPESPLRIKPRNFS